MIRAAVATLALAGAGWAAPPELSVFVTDQNTDVLVAIYGDRAVELAGCTGPDAARTLLQLPPDAVVSETTLGALQADFGFGSQPRIPCAGGAFDQDWPATAPIWADVAGSGDYFLPGLAGGHVAIPSRCTGIKTALAIRERLQLPGVLQGMTPPPDLDSTLLRLDCGQSGGTGPVIVPPGQAAGWSLHRFDTFLTEASTGDTVLVARFTPPGDGALPAYLPIWRINAAEVAPMALTDGLAGAEAAAKTLFGIPPDAPVTTLGAEAVAALRAAPYADLCTRACDGYAHRHAAFLQPGVDLGISPLPAAPVSAAIDRLGNDTLIWRFAEGRAAQFTGCGGVTAALGLAAGALSDWMAATGQAVVAEAAPAGAFDCRGNAATTCVRRLDDGTDLAPAHFAPGPDCGAATRLRVEIAAFTQTAGPLALSGAGFQVVVIAPRDAARATLRATPGRLAAATGGCVLSAADALISTTALPRLELDRIDLQRKAGAGGGDVIAVQVQGGALILSGATIGTEAEGAEPVSRGINLCLGDLYAATARIEAQTLAIQGLSSRILISGTAAERSTVARARFGLLLTSGALARLDRADVTAATPIVLRGATLAGASVTLSPISPVPPSGAGLQLERGARAELITSTVAGFRCAVSFADAASAVSLILPGNAVAADNVNLGCGAGQVRLVE